MSYVKQIRFRWVLLGTAVILLALMWLGPPRARATTSTITGTIQDAQGNPVNGTLTFQLPVPAQDTATNIAIAPILERYYVVNGAIQSGPPLYDVAGLQPKNLYYVAKVYDTAGNLILSGNYVVTGASFNFGSATPTTVTTSNISYVTPVTTSAPNTFTALQTFGSGFTSNGTSTMGAQLNSQSVVPTTASAYNLGGTTLPFSTLYLGTSNTHVTALASNNVSGTETVNIPDVGAGVTTTIEAIIQSGSSALNTAVLGAAGCQATITVAVPNATTSSRIIWNYATDPSAVAGYGAAPIDAVHILAWPTGGAVNFKQCSSVAVTPGAISIQWNVVN